MKRFNRVLSLLLAVALAISILPAAAMAADAPAFSDVDGHWAESSIERWVSEGVINGKDENTFDPDGLLTRAELMKILSTTLKLEDKADLSAFDDVSDNDWFADAAAKCVAAGIVSGTSDNTLSPNANVTREQAFTMLARALSIESESKANQGFADANQVSSYAAGYINAMANAGWLTGTGDNMLNPKASITRSSMVTILDRVVAVYANEDDANVKGAAEGVTLVVADDVTVTDGADQVLVMGRSCRLSGGEYGDVVLADDNVILTVDKDASVETVTMNGDNGKVQGSGDVAEVVVNGDDNTVTTKGTEVTVSEDATGTTAGGKEVDAGESTTIPDSSVSGGSSSGGSTHESSTLTTDIGEKTFQVGVPTEFTFTTTANDDAGKMVIGTSNFNDEDAIAKLEYYEVQDNQWHEFSGDFGPSTGFPMADATSRFRVTFAKAGNYTFTASMKLVDGGDVLCSTEVAFTVNPAAHVSSTLTTDIGEQTFQVGVPTEFTFTTTANDDAGKMVIGTSNFNDEDAIAKLEYYEVQDNQWHEFSGDFGPSTGFPMADATSRFRVTFAKAGDYTFTASMKLVDGGDVLCSTEVSFTVEALPAGTAMVGDEATLTEALADPTIDTIWLTDSFEVTSQIVIDRPIAMDGRNETITANVWEDANPTSKGDASLVLINQADGQVTLKNITLAGAKTIGTTASGGQKDYGHGLNVFCSANVVLENVTLSGNEGAGMVINSSTVTATGLHTSGNGWGGVNVDKNEDPAAVFTFDETSTFNEDAGKPAVYSDGGKVTVNAPAGYACAQVGGVYVWAQLFEGGLGTAESPYEIKTAQQLYNVGLLTDAENHFKLLNDIDMSGIAPSAANSYGETGDLYWLSGELDGAGHQITSTKDTAGTIVQTKNAVIKNVTFLVDDHAAVANANSTTFENVTVIGTMSVGNNNGAFVTYADPANKQVTLTFNNCTANVTMVGEGADTNYNAVFVGYAYGGGNATELHFTNCTNEGSLVCGRAAMFLGNNAANQGFVTIYVDDCLNNGEIRSTYTDTEYGWNHFIATGAHANNTVVLNGESLASATEGSVPVGENGGFYQGPADTTLELTENDDGTFTITKSSNENVDHYVVTMSLYATLLNADGTPEGGTVVVSVSERIDATDAETYQTTMKHLSLVDEMWVNANSDLEPTTEGAGEYTRTLYTKDGQSYYYLGSEADTMATLNGTPKAPQAISVSAYDADGNLLCSVALSK